MVKILKQTALPMTTVAPKAKVMSMSFVVYGILFVAWIAIKLSI